jgi:hypothetical protein
LIDKPVFKNPSDLPTGFKGTYGVDLAPDSDGLSLPSGSPGLDSGAILEDDYRGSINSVLRPAGKGWDVGAYEQPGKY